MYKWADTRRVGRGLNVSTSTESYILLRGSMVLSDEKTRVPHFVAFTAMDLEIGTNNILINIEVVHVEDVQSELFFKSYIVC